MRVSTGHEYPTNGGLFAFEPDTTSDRTESKGDSNLTAPLTPRAERSFPEGKVSPQAGHRARRETPGERRSNLITDEFLNLAGSVIPEDKRPLWWKQAAFDADFTKGGKVLALAIQNVDRHLAEESQSEPDEAFVGEWWAE